MVMMTDVVSTGTEDAPSSSAVVARIATGMAAALVRTTAGRIGIDRHCDEDSDDVDERMWPD
jgi:hypothetical protein